MKKSNRSIRGIAFYFMLLGIFIVGLAYSSYADRNQQVDTYADFCGWLEAGRVKAVYITPNEETPTGLVQVQLTNSEIHSFYADDILRVEEKAEEYQVRVVVQDVDKPSWFWTLVFPYLVILIAVIIVFMVLGHSLGGGGSNSQVLNFGKSRAQMTDMERFCHIRSAVINDDLPRMRSRFCRQFFICAHLFEIVADEAFRQFQVDETRIDGLR